MIVIGCLVVATTVWMYTQRPQPDVTAQRATRGSSPSAPATSSRFREDAWFLPDDELLGFVEIPAGTFLMGSDPAIDRGAFDNERWSPQAVQGSVDLPAFYIGRYEVTVAQFQMFADATGFQVNAEAVASPGDHPVGNVSWPAALAYCRWLEAMLARWSGTPSRLMRLLGSGWRVSLPTEAQWEKAARSTDSRIFPWGDDPSGDRANYDGSTTRPVGSYACPECPFGVSDMSGNVWELTRSPYQPYPYNPADDRGGLDADALWVMRGGSYIDPARNIRVTTRGGADPGARRPFIGFRLVITRTGL